MIIEGEPVLMFPVDAKVDAVMPDGTHHYWSTHCRHGNHGLCKRVCKTCSAPCGCREADCPCAGVAG